MSAKAQLIKLYKTILPLSLREKMRIKYDEWERYVRVDLKLQKKYTYKKTGLKFSGKISGDPSFTIFVICKKAEPLDSETQASVEQQAYNQYDFVRYDAEEFNTALRNSKGDYIVFLQNGDLLTEDALLASVSEIRIKTPDLIYSDNDHFVKKGKYILPDFKPDFSPESLLSKNYLTGFIAFKKSTFLPWLDKPFEEYLSYDALLKISEKENFSSKHISSVLYHKKITAEQSKSPEKINSGFSPEETRKVLHAALKRRNIEAEIESNYPDIFRIKRRLKSNPLVSILIPFKDKPEILKTCLDSILKLSTYQNFEIIGINNNSSEAGTFEMMKEYSTKHSRIQFIDLNIPFNFSTLNNRAAEVSKGEHLILLNNDIEIITQDWIESLLEYSQEPKIGVVGAKLYYPNNLVQHAGVMIGIGGVGGHVHKMYHRNDYGYSGRLQYAQNITALTAACFMVKKSIYLKVAGLDEKNFEVAFNDIDFCLKVQYNGYRNIFTPYCEAYHYESISRGSENTPEKLNRFRREIDAFKNMHRNILEKGDPYYNPNLTLKFEDYSIR